MRDPKVYKYNINQLPHDIMCYIFAFLTVGDSSRARLSSSGWLHLPDSRSVLQFDSLNVLGKETAHVDEHSPAIQSKFVKIANRFLQVWAGERIHTLVVRFVLGKEHASDIDRWIATSARMDVEEIALDFSGTVSQGSYVFPSHLIRFENAPYLKRLCLKACTLGVCSQCTRWSSNLTTLDLCNVPLDECKIYFILSAGSNLTTLGLFNCNLPSFVRIEHVRLKKLSIYDTFFLMYLLCPNLEMLECHGSIKVIMFSKVPVLREIKLISHLRPDRFSVFFYHLTRFTPHLQVLWLPLVAEVKLSFLATLRSLNSLKQLKISVSFGFDLLSITCLLNASPILETLQIKLNRPSDVTSIKKGRYPKNTHLHLKEVKIEGFHDQWNEMGLASYILRYAVALEKMVIELPTNRDSRLRWKVWTQLLKQQKLNPNAQVVII